MVGLNRGGVSISLIRQGLESAEIVEEQDLCPYSFNMSSDSMNGEKGENMNLKGYSLIHKMNSWVWFIVRR